MALLAPDAARVQTGRKYRAKAHFPLWLRHALRTVLHFAADALAVAVSYRLAYLLRFHSERWVAAFPIPGTVPAWNLYAQLLWIVVPLWLAIFSYSARLYNTPWINGTDRFLKILKGCFLGTLATLAATYVYSRLEYSRMMMLMALPISLVLISLSQSLVLWIDDRLSRYENVRPVLLVGGTTLAQLIKTRIRHRHPEAQIHELSELPVRAKLERMLDEHPFYELILLRSSLPHDRILETAEVCDSRDVAFKMVPDLLELRLGEVQLDQSLGLPAYRIQHAAMTRLNFTTKRAFDLFFCLLVLLVAGVPWLLVSLLIKLDSKGPVLYKQKRYGYKGRIFQAYKFRTMVTDAEAKIAAIKEHNGQNGPFFKAKDDPRVTRVGRWLRRFSLDEFPQFLNVLAGEMSVVGPRPLAVSTGEMEAILGEFGETAKKRMNILPGITGLWQVSGRSDVSSAQRFALDIFYVEHWTLGLDLEIILKTAPAMILAKGAY